MRMNLPRWALERLTSEEKVEVMEAYYAAAGDAVAAANQPMGLGGGIAIAGVALGVSITLWAVCKYCGGGRS